MGDQEEDFSQLPLPDRFTHKNWKVRKEGYEAAAKEFDKAQGEDDPVVRQFILDSGIWKGVVADSNVAAQTEGMNALCSFLQIAGTQGCTRTRNVTIAPIVEKGLLGRPAAKAKAQELLLLYVELDRPDPVIEEMLPLLSHKLPKVIAATLEGLKEMVHAYGCKTIEPKSILKVLPKVFGHADKNVRAQAQNLTVEFYRWLKEAMKPLFWNELKPVQQTDLDKLFEPIKSEPPPKQERLLRSQQEAAEAAEAAGGDGGEAGGDEDEAEIDLEPEYIAVDVMAKVPKDFSERLSSSKWKDRKEALDDLHNAINVPAIEEGPFDDIMRGLAKSMKDANIAVVTVAANCVEIFAKGLRKGFTKYRSTVFSPMLERLKEKKASVTEALGNALDAVVTSTSLNENLEEILEAFKHKNPQVKLETTRLMIRILKNTKEAPQPPEVKAIADAATKLLTESQATQRDAGAEVLGTLWKIMGDRIMNPHLEGLDDIRKTKIKEFHDSAEVKAKYKPKAAPAPKPAAAAPTGKKPALGKRPGGAVKKPAPAAAPPRAATPEEPPASAPLAAKPTSRPGASKLGAKPTLGASRLGLKKPGLAAPSPKRAVAPPPEESEEEPAPVAKPPPKLGLGRGLAGRPLGKPASAPVTEVSTPAAPSPPPGLSAIEKAELEELRAEVERLRKQNEEMKAERSRMTSEIHELQNQNAQLIEDHTRDMLSIKAKETQLVRARSDAEEAQQTVLQQQREVERLKRELTRQVRATSPPPFDIGGDHGIYNDMNGRLSSMGGEAGYGGGYGDRYGGGYGRRNFTPQSPGGEGKENFGDSLSRSGSLSSKLSPLRRGGSGSNMSSHSSGYGGRASPALGADRSSDGGELRASNVGTGNGAESWKRAAEVTQNLKARIELMKAKQGLARQQH